MGLGVALLGSGVPGGLPAAGQAPTADTGVPAGIQRLLAHRAEAMRSGDLEAFLSTSDLSDSGFARRQRLLFAGFRRLGLEEYRLEATTATFPELTTPREVVRYGPSAEPRIFHVEERYRIRGYDQQPALEDLFLTFVWGPGGWRVASDTDLEDAGLLSGRKLWELGPIVTRDSEHFRYVSHPDLAGSADAVLGAAERALATVLRTWPLPWAPRVLILAPSRTPELARIIQATFDLDAFVAFAASGVDRALDWELTGHRIVLNWPNFSRHPASVREGILAHELSHIATRELAGPQIPVFLDEGVAEWVAGDASTAILAERVQEATFDGRLPEDHEFVTGESTDIAGAYQESFSAVRYAVERHGASALAEWYRLLGEVRLAPGTWRFHADRTLRRAVGTGLEPFERAWAAWVEREYA